jgi:hypothetical protein
VECVSAAILSDLLKKSGVPENFGGNISVAALRTFHLRGGKLVAAKLVSVRCADGAY